MKLQDCYVDVARAHHVVHTMKDTLQQACANVSTNLQASYTDGPICWYRRVHTSFCRKQCHRSNVHTDSSSDYYWLKPTIPLLDHLISEHNVCFDATTLWNVTEFMYLLPSVIVE